MSRNFELLQNLGKESALFESTPIATVDQKVPAPMAAAAAASEPGIAEAAGTVREPQLHLEPKEREELTKLTQRVFLSSGVDSARVVVFTASESGNGCSSICACAAELLAAQVNGPVCLVDANLRQPGLHQQFGVENHYGFADALQGTEPILHFARTMSRQNLWLVSCGSAPEAALPLLNTDRMRKRIAELRASADYVLIDASAMNVSNDAATLAAVADGLVIVLKANSTRRETMRKTVHDLQAARIRVLGAVLNQRTFPIPQSIYDKL
jgi:Mrp family chromosome partitioning ATPase